MEKASSALQHFIASEGREHNALISIARELAWIVTGKLKAKHE